LRYRTGYDPQHKMTCTEDRPFTNPIQSMDKNYSWEANSSSYSRCSCKLLNPKVQHRVRRNPPLSPIFSHINPVRALHNYLNYILVLFFYLCQVHTFDFPTKQLDASLFSPTRATCPITLIFPNLITLIIHLYIFIYN